jgi:hypothetical protein
LYGSRRWRPVHTIPQQDGGAENAYQNHQENKFLAILFGHLIRIRVLTRFLFPPCAPLFIKKRLKIQIHRNIGGPFRIVATNIDGVDDKEGIRILDHPNEIHDVRIESRNR